MKLKINKKGESWQKIKESSQTFAIGDRGALIVFASNLGMASNFTYSLDEGFQNIFIF